MAARMRLAQRQGLLPPHLYPALPPLPPLFSPYYHTGLPHPHGHPPAAPPPPTGTHPHHSQAVPPHLAASLSSHEVFSAAGQHHESN